MKTECGVFGSYYFKGNKETIPRTIQGLQLLQHRGRESAGISYFENDEIKIHKNSGLVSEVFKDSSKFQNVEAKSCIGHVRYSTSGKSKKGSIEYEITKEIQPFKAKDFSLVYNGNISNLPRAEQKFGIKDVKIDTEMIVKIIEKINKPTLKEKLIEFVKNVNGVYCLIILTKDGMYCLRDSYGVRPLSFCKSENGYFVSSESCAFDFMYDELHEIKSGEILYFSENSINRVYRYTHENAKICVFEYIYFMNRNTEINEKNIGKIRYETGKKLGIKEKNKFEKGNTIISGCPETGNEYGRGYAEGINLPYTQFLRKIKNSGRTFILPENSSRILACKKNLYVSGNIKNKNLILVDDSLVRGNTLKAVIETLRNCGAKSVHIRITSPPVKSPCYFGVDIPSKEELIASKLSVEEIRKFINADSLEYMDLDIIKDEIGGNKKYCSACFDGEYCDDLINW